jgi:ABC-2 type transport system permease protein
VTVVWATFFRSWTETRRAYPLTFFLGTVLIGWLTIGLGYLAFRAIGGGQVGADFVAKAGTTDYLGYIAVGAAAFMFTVRLVLWVSRALIQEQRAGTLGALLVTPAGRLPYLVGLALFAFASSLLEATVLIGFAAVLGASMIPAEPVTVLVGIGALTVASFAMSVIVGNVIIVAGEAHLTQNTFFYSIALLCGFTFPIEYLPGPAQWLAEGVPVTSALEFLRTGMTGAGAAGATPRLALSLLLSAAYTLVGLRLLPRSERQAIGRSY